VYELHEQVEFVSAQAQQMNKKITLSECCRYVVGSQAGDAAAIRASPPASSATSSVTSAITLSARRQVSGRSGLQPAVGATYSIIEEEPSWHTCSAAAIDPVAALCRAWQHAQAREACEPASSR